MTWIRENWLRLLKLLRTVQATAGAVMIGGVRAIFGGVGGRIDLAPGDLAPDFELAGSDGRTHRLSTLRGRTVVIAWFPKAFTGG